MWYYEGMFLIFSLVVMWGRVLGYVVPRGHIMGIAGLVISYDVNNYQVRRGGLCR
jgi:hypothetical protein